MTTRISTMAVAIPQEFMSHMATNWWIALVLVVLGTTIFTVADRIDGGVSSVLALAGIAVVLSALSFNAIVALLAGVPAFVVVAIMRRRADSAL